jgi:hypothetical protein
MPAEFSMKYRSVTGFGIVRAITDTAEKADALNVIMDQYEGPHLDVKAIEKMRVWVARLDIESVTGKNNYFEIGDPFYSEKNQERLSRSIQHAEDGLLTVHDLIEE